MLFTYNSYKKISFSFEKQIDKIWKALEAIFVSLNQLFAMG